MANTNCLAGMACPTCKSEGPFGIECVVNVSMADSGTDDMGELDWDDTNWCSCQNCDFTGRVLDFMKGDTDAST